MNIEQAKPHHAPVQAIRPGPSPEKFFETMMAYQRTAALKAAIELSLFTAIGEGQKTVPLLAKRINASERGARILCDCLVVLGFLTKSGDSYGLTADSAVFLDKKSPAYAGSAVKFIASPYVTDGFKDLAAVVRSGRPTADQPFADIEHPAWVEYARSMAPISHLIAQETAKLLGNLPKMKVLDVAAGHGMFGITVAQRISTATVVALDWPSVLTVAQENAQRSGILDRYSLLPGDALEVDFGTDFDTVLAPNLLHHWDRATNERFLKKAHKALAPRGRIVVVEFTPNDDRVSPPIPALFALNMLGNTTGGDAYTVAEYREMLNSAGFVNCESHAMPPTPHTAIIAEKL